MDVQIILDKEAAVRYMVKYATKGEKRSDKAAELFARVMAGDEGDPSFRWRRLMLKCVGNRDMGAQETAHSLLQLPMCRPGFEFATIALDNSREVQLNNNAGRAIVESIVDVYAERLTRAQEKEELGPLETMSLLTFGQFYKVWRGNVSIRSKKAVVKTTPRFSSNLASPKYWLYCKYSLMKFKPWRGNFLRSLGIEEEQEDEVLPSLYINVWKEFVRQQVSLSYDDVFCFYYFYKERY